MKKIKLLLLISMIFLNSVLLTGCWNYREIDSLSIVSGLAVDKSSIDGKFLVTFEVVDFKSGAGKEASLESEKIEGEGKTVFDAVRNAILISSKKLFWSHAGIAIISQDVAKESIIPLIDFINRDTEPRELIQVLVSKEKTAKELLEEKSITTDIRAFEINDMVDFTAESVAKAPKTQIYDITNMLAEEGIALTLPTIGIVVNQGEETAELSGTAIFDRDKLIGFLDSEETKSFLFVQNKIKGGLLTLKENVKSKDDNVTLEIYDNNTRVTPVYSDGIISMDIDVHTKVSIAEVDVSGNAIDEKCCERIKNAAEYMLKKNIEDTIKKVQKHYGVDIFGFGNIVKKEKPEAWKKIRDEWGNIFKNLNINVNVKLTIKSTGLISKPIQIGGYK